MDRFVILADQSIVLRPDESGGWGGLTVLREAAGAMMTVGVIVAVGAVAFWIAVGTFQRLSSIRGDGFNRVIGIVVSAGLLAALPQAVMWGTSLLGEITIPVG